MRSCRFLLPLFTMFLLSNPTTYAAMQELPKKPTIFVVVRHGESDHNVRELFNSRPNHPNYFESHLTLHGKDQVTTTGKSLLRKNLSVLNIFRGPLPRTIETSDILNTFLKAPNMKTDERLIEAGAGDLEGQHVSKVKDHWGIEEIARRYSGETRESMQKRLCSFLKDMVKHHLEEMTAIVTHGSPSEMILTMLGADRKRLTTAEAVVVPYSGSLKGCE